MDDIAPITATLRRFAELTGISRSKTYEMLNDGQLESIHVGSRRLIVLDSYLRLVQRERAKARRSAKVNPR